MKRLICNKMEETHARITLVRNSEVFGVLKCLYLRLLALFIVHGPLPVKVGALIKQHE